VLIAGYKEFLPFVQEENTDETARETAISKMKTNTRHRVKKQINRIRYQFLPLASRSNVPIYCLDSSDPSEWSTKVLEPALSVSHAFLSGSPLPRPVDYYDRADELSTPRRKRDLSERWNECEICGYRGKSMLISGGEAGWVEHLQGSRHRHRLGKREKRAARAAEEARAQLGAAAEGDTWSQEFRDGSMVLEDND